MAGLKLHFVIGLVTGMTLACILVSMNASQYISTRHLHFSDSSASRKIVVDYGLPDDKEVHHDDDFVAKQVMETVRVLIFIETSPANLKDRAKSVKDTWAKRCNKLIFFSSEDNAEFPTIGLRVPEGREHLTAKTMKAFRYVYEHYFNDFDWFMKADDDTYIIAENLHYFLSGQNASDPVHFGHHFKPIVKQGYHSGGAGYVLSKEALRRFGERAKNSSSCHDDGGYEDAEMGLCLESLGVRVGDSRDSLGRSRFHCWSPERLITGNFPHWYYQYDVYGAKKGEEHLSDYMISFHWVDPQAMRMLHFYTYHLRPYGIFNGEQKLNRNNTKN